MSHNLLSIINPNNVVENTVQQILMLMHNLEAGSKLPSERMLAKQIGVSRGCVREAIRILATMGCVDIQPGRGTFVIGNSAKLAAPQRWFPWLLAHKDEILQVLEVRSALASKGAILAALRANSQDITNLKLNVEHTEALVANPQFNLEEFIKADLEFHDLIADASGNKLLSELTKKVHRLVVEQKNEFFSFPARALTSTQQHRMIYAAISRKDPESSGRLMSAHIESVVETISFLLSVEDK